MSTLKQSDVRRLAPTHTKVEIAKELNAKYHQVRIICDTYEIETKKKGDHTAILKKMKELVAKDYTRQEIINELGLTYRKLTSILQKYKYKLPSSKQVRDKKELKETNKWIRNNSLAELNGYLFSFDGKKIYKRIKTKVREVKITKDKYRGSYKDKTNHYGYKRICYLGKTRYLHRLMWEAWDSPIPKDMTIDHIDGDRMNNHIRNLQLLTRKENSSKTIRENREKGKMHGKNK